METVEKCPGQQRPCCSDSPALSFLGSPWAGVVSEDQGDGGGYANGVGHGHGSHGQCDGEDHGDGVGHRLVLLLLDGDDRPGVGHDGEHAHRQGEEKERWVEYLTRRNITYIEYEISTRRRSRKIDHGFGYKKFTMSRNPESPKSKGLDITSMG